MIPVPEKFKQGFSHKMSGVFPVVIIYTYDNGVGKVIRLSRRKGLFGGAEGVFEDRNLSVSTIGEKVDVQKRKFQVNQVNVSVSNYSIGGERFTEKFKGNTFTNSSVDIYYANDNCKTLEDCFLIYKGFVKTYKANEKAAKFTIEDHSQYTLDIKTIPRYSTVDKYQESIDTSKDVYFPMIYGRNEKSPMIFSRPYNESLFSYIYADATHVPGIDILGFEGIWNGAYGLENEEESQEVDPLIILRDSDYLKVPNTFLDLPTDFELIAGEDYADKFNGTEQYYVSDDGNAIVLEKKISDFAFSAGLPMNIVAKDQFQVIAERSPSSLTPDQSDEPLIYGEDKEIQYLGEQDGLSSVLSENTFIYPDPSLGDIRPMGYYQNMTLRGFWDGVNDIGGDEQAPIWSTNMRYINYLKHSSVSGTTDGLTGFDLSYRPNVAGHSVWKEIFDLDKMTDWLREQPGGDLIPYDWTMDIGETRWMTSTSESVNIGIGGDNLGLKTHLAANTNLPGSLPIAGDIYDYINGEIPNYVNYPVCDYLFIRCSAENAPILVEGSGLGVWSSYLEDDQEYISITKNIFDTDWDMFLKDGIADWITIHDANKIGVDPQITNTDVTLNKILWGRKITEAEHLYTGIRRGSNIYGIFPTLGNVQITSLENDWFLNIQSQVEVYPFFNQFIETFYTLNCDALQSFGSFDIYNPPADLGDLVKHQLDGDLNYIGLEAAADISWEYSGDAKYMYNKRHNPDWIVRQHYTYPDDIAPTNDWYPDLTYSMPTLLVGGSSSGPGIEVQPDGYYWFGMVYSVEANEYGLSYHPYYNKPLNSMGKSQHVTHAGLMDFGGVGFSPGFPFIEIKGFEAMIGGQWARLSNSFGNRIASKLDLTFNSISGSDVVMGTVYSVLRGQIETYFHRDASSSDDTDANMHFMIEATSFDSTPGSDTNDVVKISEILNNTEPKTGNENEAGQQIYDTFWTGHSEDFEDNIYYGTSPTVGTEGESNYILQECNAMDQGNDYSGGDWAEDVNSVNNVSLYYYLGNDNDNVDNVAVNGYFQTRLRDFKLIQNFVIGNIAKQKYYADVWGRIDIVEDDGITGRYTGQELLGTPNQDWLIRLPSDILMHILEKELGYDNQVNDFPYDLLSLEIAREQHGGWGFGFSIKEQMDSKSFLSEFCQSCKLVPRFRYDGTFSFINFKDDNYTIDETINAEDVIKFNYERSEISDVKLMVRVNYAYDDGLETFERSTNPAQTGAAPANAQYLMERYGIRKLTDAYLEVDSRFIRDEDTAIKLRNHLLCWNMNQHNIIKCSVSPKYMHLEAGDIVNFDRLISGMTIFGQDYTKEFFIGLPDQSETGQVVYPYFMVQEIKKSESRVDLVLFQIHKYDESVIVNDALDTYGANFGVNVHWDEGGSGDEGDYGLHQIYLGDVNFDQSIDINDIVQIVGHIVESTSLNGYNFAAADVDQDNYVTVLDVIQVAIFVINEGEYGELGVTYV